MSYAMTYCGQDFLNEDGTAVNLLGTKGAEAMQNFADLITKISCGAFTGSVQESAGRSYCSGIQKGGDGMGRTMGASGNISE